jgi:hypothetical protein
LEEECGQEEEDPVMGGNLYSGFTQEYSRLSLAGDELGLIRAHPSFVLNRDAAYAGQMLEGRKYVAGAWGTDPQIPSIKGATLPQAIKFETSARC